MEYKWVVDCDYDENLIEEIAKELYAVLVGAGAVTRRAARLLTLEPCQTSGGPRLRSLPTRPGISSDVWTHHTGLMLPSGQVFDGLRRELHSSPRGFVKHIVGDAEVAIMLDGSACRRCYDAG